MKLSFSSSYHWHRRSLHNLYGVALLLPHCFDVIKDPERYKERKSGSKHTKSKTH